MLATPVSGIIAAIKAVRDLIQFVRENMSAISGLVQAVTSTLAQAATGDGSVVANGVEAALCRLIPLAVDVVLRLAGVNVGGAIQGVVDKIRTRVKGIVDKIIAKLKVLIAKTPIGKVLETVSKTKKAVGNAKKGIKDKIDATVDKGIDKAGRLVDPHLDKAAHKFNHSSADKKLAAFNDKAQGFADSVNAFTQAASTKTAGMRGTMETATNVLQDFNRADKYGDAFGIDSEAVANSIKESSNQEDHEREQEYKTSGAINTEPQTLRELKELEALAENLYDQQRRSTVDVQKIAESTGWPVERVAAIKNYIFYQKHKLEKDEEPRRFDANMGMIQSWRRMALGKSTALEKHDILLLQHEWLEMEIKRENPNIDHQKAHEIASQYFNYAEAEKEFNNGKDKKISISERIRRKGTILPGK